MPEPADAGEDEKGLERLLSRLEPLLEKGDSKALVDLVREYGRDNVDLRTKNRELTKELATVKGKVKDGDVILSGEDAKHFAAIQKLGIPLKDVAQQLEAGKTALEENAGFKQVEASDEAGEILGWNKKVLRSLVKLNRLTLDFQEVADDEAELDASGKRPKKKVPVVVPDDEEENPVPLAEYVNEHLGDFRDALAGAEAARKSDREAPTPQGPRMVRQRSGEQGPRGGVSEKELDTQKRRQVNYSA